jgi:hypothetical protein
MPVTKGLVLDAAGVAVGGNGIVVTDRHPDTTCPGLCSRRCDRPDAAHSRCPGDDQIAAHNALRRRWWPAGPWRRLGGKLPWRQVTSRCSLPPGAASWPPWWRWRLPWQNIGCGPTLIGKGGVPLEEVLLVRTGGRAWQVAKRRRGMVPAWLILACPIQSNISLYSRDLYLLVVFERTVWYEVIYADRV